MGSLAIAAREGHLEVVGALLAAGASVEAKGNSGPGPRRRMLWEGGATGESWKRHDMTLRLLQVLGTSFQESDSVNLRTMKFT